MQNCVALSPRDRAGGRLGRRNFFERDSTDGTGGNSYTAKVFSNTNVAVWSMQRILPYSDAGTLGRIPTCGAYRAAQVVLGGHYISDDHTAVGWIQAYAP